MKTSYSSAPVWKQPRGSYGSNYWEFYSLKLDREVHFYSNLERDHGVLVEADPSISWYCEQPIRIKIKVDGHDRETILDMLVRYRDGREEYREVKHGKDLAQQDKYVGIGRQLKAQRTWARVTASHYRVVTEEYIRHNRLFLNNWKRVLAHLAATAHCSLCELEDQILTAFIKQPVWRFADMEQYCQPESPQVCRAAIYRLIHRGLLLAPLAEIPITREMTVRRTAP